MSDSASFLSIGSPRFLDSRLEQLARAQGDQSAWQEAVRKDARTAAAGVTGDFGIALREPGGRVFLAVDRFAIQTLCYCVVDGHLHFASKADELVEADAQIDPQAIFDYLYFHAIPSPGTIFKDVYRLPPGHYAVFEGGHLTVAPYWVPAFEETRHPSFDALKSEFRQLLRDAVAEQVDLEKPACFLSGGTDSSTVAGMMARNSGKTAATYSIGFDAQGYDEMEFARLASRHFKTEHHEYYVTPDDLVQSIPVVAASCDQPFGNSSILPAYYCARVARQDGVRKLLSGDGGDELFGGNTRYAKQRVFGWYDHVPSLVRRRLMEPMLNTRAAAAIHLTRKAGSYVEQARVTMPDRLQMYNLIMRLGAAEVLTPRMLEAVDTTRPLQLQRTVWEGTQDCSHLNKELAFDWRFTLAESDLPKVRSATDLAGVRTGYPMLDHRLLEFSLKLPTEYKLKGLQLRWFFKEALRDFLPNEIISKKKQGFGLPFGVWANRTPALMALARESLESLASRGVVRVDFVQTLLKQHLPAHPGYYGEMVWILMMLEQWLRAKAPSFNMAD
jgi:asparagine synthase (glutamine-hydrolysing)